MLLWILGENLDILREKLDKNLVKKNSSYKFCSHRKIIFLLDYFIWYFYFRFFMFLLVLSDILLFFLFIKFSLIQRNIKICIRMGAYVYVRIDTTLVFMLFNITIFGYFKLLIKQQHLFSLNHEETI